MGYNPSSSLVVSNLTVNILDSSCNQIAVAASMSLSPGSTIGGRKGGAMGL